MASSTPRSSSSIVRLLDLLRVVSRLERRSGFSSTLGIDHNYFRGLSSPDELDWNESTRTLTVVVPMTDRLAFSSTGDDATANNAATTKRAKVVGNLSTFQALIDDMTTWAFVLADPQRGRAGVSVTLSTEWAPPPPSTSTYGSPYQQPPRHISVGDAVVIESTVNKVGTNVGFSTAAIRTMEGDPVCFGSHVKFLPLGFVTDFLSSSVGWPLARLYAEYWLSDGPAAPPDDDPPPVLADLLASSVEFVSENRATCSVTRHHASLGGPIHGGCQAVLMELVATRYLQEDRKTRSTLRRHRDNDSAGTSGSGALYVLHSMDLEYVSKPSSKKVEITVQEVLPHSRSGGGDNKKDYSSDALLRPIQVVLESHGRVNSYGMLRFLRVHS